jgi:hypothetical protein
MRYISNVFPRQKLRLSHLVSHGSIYQDSSPTMDETQLLFFQKVYLSIMYILMS